MFKFRFRLKFFIFALLMALLPEFAQWIAFLGSRSVGTDSGTCSILVLGFPARADGSPHPMQRERVEVAAKLMKKAGCDQMVLSGGNPHSSSIEAEVMGDLAHAAGIPISQIALERRSHNTWENVTNSLPLLIPVDTIFIVSDSLHVHRGKRYLCQQKPDLCVRTIPISSYSPGRYYPYKCWSLFHESFAFIRDAAIYAQ